MTQVATDAVPNTIRQSCHPHNRVPGPRLAHVNAQCTGHTEGKNEWALTVLSINTWTVGHRGECFYTGPMKGSLIWSKRRCIRFSQMANKKA